MRRIFSIAISQSQIELKKLYGLTYKAHRIVYEQMNTDKMCTRCTIFVHRIVVDSFNRRCAKSTGKFVKWMALCLPTQKTIYVLYMGLRPF